jgi:hypothetical protein
MQTIFLYALYGCSFISLVLFAICGIGLIVEPTKDGQQTFVRAMRYYLWMFIVIGAIAYILETIREW